MVLVFDYFKLILKKKEILRNYEYQLDELESIFKNINDKKVSLDRSIAFEYIKLNKLEKKEKEADWFYLVSMILLILGGLSLLTYPYLNMIFTKFISLLIVIGFNIGSFLVIYGSYKSVFALNKLVFRKEISKQNELIDDLLLKKSEVNKESMLVYDRKEELQNKIQTLKIEVEEYDITFNKLVLVLDRILAKQIDNNIIDIDIKRERSFIKE